MNKITINKNTSGDSRTATKIPTFEEFENANKTHREDVQKVLTAICEELVWRGEDHDWCKFIEPMRSEFYRELCDTIQGKMKFEEGEWLDYHYKMERHHLLGYVHDDVNLIDVLEMIADCVCAGMARSGEVRPLEIDETILSKAVDNTVKMLVGAIKLIG